MSNGPSNKAHKISNEISDLFDGLTKGQLVALHQKGVTPKELATLHQKGHVLRPFHDSDIDVAPEDLFRHPDLPLSYQSDVRNNLPPLTDGQAAILRKLYLPVSLPEEGTLGVGFSDNVARLVPSQIQRGSESADSFGLHPVASVHSICSFRQRV